MRKKSNLLLLIPAVILLFITGCKQNTAISNSKLTDYYAKSINGLADVMDGYSQSLETGSNYVYEPAKKQLTWINSTQDKLKEDKSGSKKTKYLSKFLDSLDDEIREYKDNNFNDEASTGASIAKNRKDFEKTVNVDDSTKVSKAKAKINKSSLRLKNAIKSQPHVDGKSVINSAGEITFDSISEVPGFEGEKTVEVKYTYKNTTSEPQEADRALLASGDFTQDSDDSVNTLEMGIADSDWDDAHPDDHQMYSDSTLTKLKAGETKQYVTFLKVDSFDNPITFTATNSDTNQEIGKIKLTID